MSGKKWEQQNTPLDSHTPPRRTRPWTSELLFLVLLCVPVLYGGRVSQYKDKVAPKIWHTVGSN